MFPFEGECKNVRMARKRPPRLKKMRGKIKKSSSLRGLKIIPTKLPLYVNGLSIDWLDVTFCQAHSGSGKCNRLAS